MVDLVGCVLDETIEKVKFFFGLRIRTKILAFFYRLTVLNLLVRLSFTLVIYVWLSDKAKETMVNVLLVKDLFVKLSLMPYLVLSDSVWAHVLKQIGIVNSARSQCQLVDVGKSKELNRWIAKLSIVWHIEFTDCAPPEPRACLKPCRKYIIVTPRCDFIIAEIHIFNSLQIVDSVRNFGQLVMWKIQKLELPEIVFTSNSGVKKCCDIII